MYQISEFGDVEDADGNLVANIRLTYGGDANVGINSDCEYPLTNKRRFSRVMKRVAPNFGGRSYCVCTHCVCIYTVSVRAYIRALWPGASSYPGLREGHTSLRPKQNAREMCELRAFISNTKAFRDVLKGLE